MFSLTRKNIFNATRKLCPSAFTALYHFLRFGKTQGRLKSVALDLVQSVMLREQRPASHQFVGDSQRDISFLASLLSLDREKPTVVLAAESADFDYAHLLKKISLCYGSSYNANVVHLFGKDSDATDEFTPLGPTASQDTDPNHPYLEFSNQLLFEIIDHINAVGTVYVSNERGPVFDHLVQTPAKFHLLAPDRLEADFAEAICVNRAKLETIVLPACESNGQVETSGHPNVTIAKFDFKIANYPLTDTASEADERIDLKQAFAVAPQGRLIIGSGDLNLRSGFDRFAATAISHLKGSGNSEDRFAWFGKLQDQDLEFAQVLLEDLTNAKLQDRFLISDQVDQFAAGLNSADAVLLTQRPGCRHSFIADAVGSQTPIVWFAGNPQKEVHLGEDDPLRAYDAQSAACQYRFVVC